VRVQAQNALTNLANAKVTIDVGGSVAPLDTYTGSNGVAVIQVDGSRVGKPGHLIVEANGYQKFTQFVDVVAGDLPLDIRLVPGENPTPLPSPITTLIPTPTSVPNLILAESTFDDNDEDWIVTGNGNGPFHSRSGGNLGGCIRIDDSGGDIDFMWQAPQKFLGNQSAAYGGLLLFDLKEDPMTGTPSFSQTDDIVLVGGGITLYFDTQGIPDAQWRTYAARLQESAGWRKEDGERPSPEEMQKVLAQLDRLIIRGEYYHDGEETGWLDNVLLLRRT